MAVDVHIADIAQLYLPVVSHVFLQSQSLGNRYDVSVGVKDAGMA